jgi:N-acetylmuramic acid 6-phosphate etherase
MDQFQHLQTEAQNPASERLDELQSVEIVELMCKEDALIPAAVLSQKREISLAIDVLADRFSKGGRLIYLGAGTSGRLGVLDASECPPTFHTSPSQVVGLIAGGRGAMFEAVEGAEDSPAQGEQDLAAIKVTKNDVVCGIATSGRTPYVLGGIEYARKSGAFTIGLACTTDSELSKATDLSIAPIVGPEILTGSTRLKAGTATKLVLNMLTTGAMVRLGKSFGNLMVDLKATNVKLKARANRIVRNITNINYQEAETVLNRCAGEVKTAIVAQLCKLSADEARKRLSASGGKVKIALGDATQQLIRTTDQPTRSDLVLGIDGGGTTTVCFLATAESGEILGRGTAGPSNIQAVGVPLGLRALDDCINNAFSNAGLTRSTVAAACLGLAGIDRQEGLDVIHNWASQVGLAHDVSVANDATLLLAAGTPEGWGLAVIAGTGSIAFSKTQDGKIARSGGWGYTLGDEGSAYLVALSALKAAIRSFDKIGPPTILTKRFVEKMAVNSPPDFIPAVYRGAWDRAAIASLAPMVLDAAAEGDETALNVVRRQAEELAMTAFSAVNNNNLPFDNLPIALAGGVLLHSETYRNIFINKLKSLSISPGKINLVPDPAVGAIVLARAKAKK